MTQSKLTFTTNPALPCTCIVCSKPANGETQFLDFGASLDWYGAIIICIECAREVAQVIDYHPVAQVQSLETQVRSLTTLNRGLHEENDKLHATLDSLFKLRPDLQPDGPRSEHTVNSAVVSTKLGSTKASSGPSKPATK